MPDDTSELSREALLSRYTIQPAVATAGRKHRLPFKFLDSYDVSDADIFFGRDAEIQELLRQYHSHGHMLIYGESGSGKTSLVQCGLRSRIPTEDALFIQLRVHVGGVPAVCREIAERVARDTGLPCEASPAWGLVETIREGCQAASKPIVLFFDQFEELFIFHSPQQRRRFAEELGGILSAGLNCKVLLGIRQDFLACLTELEDYAPGVFENRFWLRRMSRDNAADAVMQACATCHVALDRRLADSIIRRLDPDGRGVELPYVQVVMDRLYHEAVDANPDHPAITGDSVEKLGDVARILGTFLVDEVHRLPSPDEGRQILKTFVTRAGTRRTHDREGVVRESRGFGVKLSAAEVNDYLNQLVNSRILREIAETDSFELRHDALAATVSNWITEVERELIKVRDNLVNRFQEFEARGRARSALLDGDFLEYLGVYLKRLDPLLNPSLRGFIRESKQQRERSQKGRQRAVVAGVSASFVILAAFAGIVFFQLQRIQTTQLEIVEQQVKSIRTATPASVPALIRSIQFSNDQVADNRAVAELWKQLEASDHPKDSARFKMAVLQLDHANALERGIDTELVNELFRTNGPEFLNFRSALANNSQLDLEMLWSIVTDHEQNRTRRFRAAAALALFDPNNPAWIKVANEVTSQLLSQNTLELSAWIEAIRPVRQHLFPHLRQAMNEPESSVRNAAVDCAAALFRDQPEKLFELIEQSDEQQHRVLVRAFRDNPAAHAVLAQRTAVVLNAKNAESNLALVNLALAMIAVNRGDALVKLLAAAEDESLRTALIHRAGPSRVSWQFFADLFDHDDPDVTAAALLALGEYPMDTLSPNDQLSLMPRVIALFESHPAAVVHSAAEWLLRAWRADSGLTTITRTQRGATSAQESPTGERNWYVNSVGITMARVITTPCELGSLPEEPDRPDFRELGLPDLEPRRKWKIPRNFEISTREISVADYLAFVIDTGRKSFQYDKRYAPEVTCPINSVKWFDAVAYCSWLSQQEGLPMCYPTPDKVGPAMQLPDDLLERTGYRLPTAAEWEFACRAGTTTPRHFGQTDGWINKYAWSELNSGEASHPSGLLKPNRFGLFDMHGNVTEWCHTWWFEETRDVADSKPVDVLLDGLVPRRGTKKEYRGGAFTDKPRAIRSAHRGGPDEEECGLEPYMVFESLGFRIVRTISSEADQPPIK